MQKVAIIGAGNVGTIAAYCVARTNMADVALVDVVKGMPQSKAQDLQKSASRVGIEATIEGSNDYAILKDARVVVHTAGLPRKPGMDRMDLLKTNVEIARVASEAIVRYAPNAIVIVVANPLDVITMAVQRATQFPSNRVFGMAGVLDATRLCYFVAEQLQVWPGDITGLVLGGHGDSMVPLPQYTTVGGVPLTSLMDAPEIEKIAARTRVGGGEIVSHLKIGGAYYAPGASAATMVEAILRNTPRLEPTSAYLNGEYGFSDIYLGVPAIIGPQGVHRIIEIELNAQEKEALRNSATQVQEGVRLLDTL